MQTVEDEARLTSAACQGSLIAFEMLVTQYEPRIRHMLFGLTHDVHLTQDLCQETFLAVYRALPRMNGSELHFSSWLYRIALNQVRSEWRRRKHVTLIPFSASVSESDECIEELSEQYVIRDEHFEERIAQRDLVHSTLKHMPQSSALCLILDAAGFSYREIAEMLSDTLPAVRSRLSRARQSFQRIYNDLDQQPGS